MSENNIDISGELTVGTDYRYGQTAFAATAPINTFNLTFDLNGAGSAVFEPKDDITPLESVRLSHMFLLASCSIGNRAFYNYGQFIKDHKLERHFIITPNA